jgi:4-hydroxybenzoate polyprenyltransferase
MLVMRYGVIKPLIGFNGFELQLSLYSFLILTFATICITAAGYIINDYFDTRIDALNKPNRIIIGNTIERRFALSLLTILNVIGVVLGFYVSFIIKVPALGLIFPIVSGLLWFYSTTYKKQLIIGNLVISCITALVPLIVIYYEIPPLNHYYHDLIMSSGEDFSYVLHWIYFYAFFAFILTLIREIVKDMEDFEGGEAYGRNTLPIVTGIKFTKTVVLSLILLFLIFLGVIYVKYLKDMITLIYILIFIIIPLLVIGIRTLKANKKDDYHLISGIIKLVMLAGVVYGMMIQILLKINL